MDAAIMGIVVIKCSIIDRSLAAVRWFLFLELKRISFRWARNKTKKFL